MIVLWPAVAVLGFMALSGLVILLGTSSTARYEFERNRVDGERQRPTAPAGPRRRAAGRRATGAATGAAGSAAGPAAGGDAAREPGRGDAPAEDRPQGTTLGLATHPAGRAVEPGAAAAWWLVDEADDETGAQVVAGPFPDRIDADWVALSSGLTSSVRAVHGVYRAGGALVRRHSPDERAWLAELGAQLDTLAEDWDELLTDTDVLTTLVVEVAAALVEAGLALHDCGGRGQEGRAAAGGVCLTPEPGLGGILVSWRQHDRMSVHQVRGPALDEAVQRTMNAAVAELLAQSGFTVTSFERAGCHLVTPAHG